MAYTAIIKDGGLFIPNVLSELDDGNSQIIQVELDLDAIRAQLQAPDAPKPAKTAKKPPKRAAKKPVAKQTENIDMYEDDKGIDKLAGLDDRELSEIIKAYMSEEPVPLDQL